MGTAKIEVVFTHVGEHVIVDLQQPRPDVSAQGSAPEPGPNGHGSSTTATTTPASSA
jgi:hypothetical protein